MTKQIERKFSKEVSDKQEVCLESGKYHAHIRWENGKCVWKKLSYRGKHDSGPHLLRTFLSGSEIEDLRDLLNSMLEELQEVPEE